MLATTVDKAAVINKDSEVDPNWDQNDPTIDTLALIINTLNILLGTADPPSKLFRYFFP